MGNETFELRSRSENGPSASWAHSSRRRRAGRRSRSSLQGTPGAKDWRQRHLNSRTLRGESPAEVHVTRRTLRQTCSWGEPGAPFAFKDSMIH